MDGRGKYKQKDRDKFAKSGVAMSDGSYPINDAEDLDNAIHAVGRGGADHDSIRKHIIKRAKALGLSSKIPDNWNADGSLQQNGNHMDVESRKLRAEQMRGREVRLVAADAFEVRDLGDGQFNIRGTASVTNHAYDMGWFQETIRSGAFEQTLRNKPDVQLLVNHTGLPLARTVSGTLRLAETDNGLDFDADVDSGMSAARDVKIAAARGDMNQCSFAFSGARSEWNEDYDQREIVSLDIHRGDVSVVNQGANPATSFTMRSMIDRLIEPSDEAFAELRELLGPDDLQAALITLQRLMPAPEVTEVEKVHDLDLYRARLYALAARARV